VSLALNNAQGELSPLEVFCGNVGDTDGGDGLAFGQTGMAGCVFSGNQTVAAGPLIIFRLAITTSRRLDLLQQFPASAAPAAPSVPP